MSPRKYLVLVALGLFHTVNGNWSIYRGANCLGDQYFHNNLINIIGHYCDWDRNNQWKLKSKEHPKSFAHDRSGSLLYFINLPRNDPYSVIFYGERTLHYIALNEDCEFHFASTFSEYPSTDEQLILDDLFMCEPIS
ncbi:BgTH12-03245 [Blumeria graminis f. sp. triticale]|uniref:BgTH12-03245 n=1 Tax=Blumeria graminis f. sp. triticale TaxID=1689686 RepID=A0A9W4GH70_BLUGR|nr:BgTH12-03245 [Blumeria graminis f. sp. triticale]